MRADDRYTWLDGKAAERLLSGAPAGGPPAEGTTPLAAVLGELAEVRTTAATTDRTSAPDDGELPGEAAALAAFRAARLRTPDDGEVGARPGRRSPRAGTPPRVRMLGRPLRAGIATAAIGCVLCGVAVAAGTGALPAPFGRGGGSSSPVSSESSAAPGDGGSPLSAPGTPYGDHWRNGGRGDAARNGDSPDAQDDDSGDRAAGSGPEDAAGRDGSRDRTRAAVLCERHAADRLSGTERAWLEGAAGGPDKVVGYCRRHGGPEGVSGGGNGSPGGHPAGGGVSTNGGGASDSPGSSGSSSSGSSGSPGASGGTGGGPPGDTGDPVSGGRGASGGTGGAGDEAGLPDHDRPRYGPVGGAGREEPSHGAGGSAPGSTEVADSGPSAPPDSRG